MNFQESTDTDYGQVAANAAAAFFHHCMFHARHGVHDCDDKWIIYGTRGIEHLASLRDRLQAMGLAHIVGRHDNAWAVVIPDYTHSIDHALMTGILHDILGIDSAN